MARRKKPNEDQPNESSENINESDDTFGLPEIEYEPLNRDQNESQPTEEPKAEETPAYESSSEYRTEEPNDVVDERPPLEDTPSSYSYSYKEESSSSGGKAFLIVLLILAVLAAGLYFFYFKPKWDEEDRLAQLAEHNRALALKREQMRRDSVQHVEEERQRRIADSLALVNAKPAEGTIETLSGRTGRYYVIAASDVDDDLLMDYANKLSKKGVSSKIIPPHGKVKFFRLAIGDGDTFSETQNKANDMKGEYGDALWVVKY